MVKIDGSELTKLAQDAQRAAPQTRAAAVRTVKSASFAVERRIKTEMPVDTGRARASWGHADAGLLLKPNPYATPLLDAVWDELDEGLTIVQGSNVPYIEFLNNGHSAQAPAGFLDVAQLVGQVELEKALGLIDPLDPNLHWLSFV